MIILLYLSNKKSIAKLISREIYLINNFKVNILINQNIIVLEKIDILTF